MAWQAATYDELVAAGDGAPWVQQVVSPEQCLAVVDGSQWAVVSPWRPDGAFWGGLAVCEPGAETSALELITELADANGVTPEWFSTTGDREMALPAGWAVSGSGRWDYLWTDRLHDDSAPLGVRLVELDDTEDADEIEAFGRGHNPLFEGFPGRGYASHWLGLRDGGRLVAVGALHRTGHDLPHLAGIVVDPDRRGQGLGRAITVELTRTALADTGVATLGVYSDNLGAIRLYEGLGYRTGHRLHTYDLVRA